MDHSNKTMRNFPPLLAKGRSKWKMGQGMSANLITVCVTEKENKYGKIIHFTKAIGLTIEQTEEEDLYMQMVMFIKESGKTIKRTDMEFIQGLMIQVIQGIGLKIYNTDMA